MNFDAIKDTCKYKHESQAARRRGNHLNIEVIGGGTFCILQSPDGRGAAWLLSGGGIEAYGRCYEYRCPLLKEKGANMEEPRDGKKAESATLIATLLVIAEQLATLVQQTKRIADTLEARQEETKQQTEHLRFIAAALEAIYEK